MRIVPFLLAGGLLAAAALAPLAERKQPGFDYARIFVECSDRLGPAACAGYLDRWEEDRPDARTEIRQRFARDQAFAMHLIALTDAQILTGSVPADTIDRQPPMSDAVQPFPGE